MNKSLKFLAGLFVSIIFLNATAQTVQDGLKALEYEQNTKAGTIFENLAKSQPTPDNLYFLGYYYLKTDQTEKAKDAFDKAASAAAADSKNPWGSMVKGLYALSQNKQADAKVEFDKAIQVTKGKKADILYRIGEAYTYFPADEKKRDIARAVEVLDKAALIDPKNPDIFATLGDAYIVKNDGSNSAKNYEIATRLNEKAAKAYINYGNVLVRARNGDEAFKNYNKGLEVDPNYTPGYLRRAAFYYSRSAYTQAIADLEKYISLSENKNEARWELAKSLYLNARNLQSDRTQQAGATEMFKKTIELLNDYKGSNPNIDPVSYRMLGVSQYETKVYPEGLTNMETLFQKLDPKKVQTLDYKYYGKLLAANGKDSLAIITLEKVALTDTSSDWELDKIIGDLHYKKKNYDKAAESYKKVIAKKGDKASPSDYFTLGRTYFFGEKYTEADTTFGSMVSLYRANLEKAGDNATAVTNANAGIALGYLYKAKTKAQKDSKENGKDLKWMAVDEYNKYVSAVREEDKPKQKDNLIEAYNYLGGSEFFKNKNNAKAKEWWTKILEIDPENKRAKENLEFLKPQPQPQPKPKSTTTQKTTPKPNGDK